MPVTVGGYSQHPVLNVSTAAWRKWDRLVTAMVWVRKTLSGGTPSGFGRGYETAGGGVVPIRLYLNEAENGMRFSCGRWTSGNANWDLTIPSFSTVVREWNCHIISYDSSNTSNTPRWWLGGIEQSITLTSLAPSGTWTTPTVTSVAIGNAADGSRYLNGAVAHFAVWNRLLSSVEVLQAYRYGPLAVPRSLFAYYPFDATQPLGMYTERVGLYGTARRYTVGQKSEMTTTDPYAGQYIGSPSIRRFVAVGTIPVARSAGGIIPSSPPTPLYPSVQSIDGIRAQTETDGASFTVRLDASSPMIPAADVANVGWSVVP